MWDLLGIIAPRCDIGQKELCLLLKDHIWTRKYLVHYPERLRTIAVLSVGLNSAGCVHSVVPVVVFTYSGLELPSPTLSAKLEKRFIGLMTAGGQQTYVRI